MPEHPFNKVAGRPATLLKKRLWHRYFPVNFAKFLRKLFLQNTSTTSSLLVASQIRGLFEKILKHDYQEGGRGEKGVYGFLMF